MRVLFLGDVVGRSGRTAVVEKLPDLKKILMERMLQVVSG
jgi:calcineurin-like phosphoesterase